MVELDQMKVELQQLKPSLTEVLGSLSLPEKKKRIEELDMEMASPDFWNDPDRANKLSRECKNLKDTVEACEGMEQSYDDIGVLIEMGNEENDTSMIDEVRSELDKLIETARVAVTLEDQKAAYDAIQIYENENVEVIPLFYIPSWVVTSSHLDTKGNKAGNDQFAYQKNILDWDIDRADKTLYTNTGAVNFLEHPATNPALFWHQEIVFDRLLNADTSLAPTDGLLAESFEVSEDGKTITFTIRDGVKWHDGEPFTAEDVKWTFEYYPTVPGANTVMTDVVNDAKAITVDGNKVTFEFNSPQPNALTIFSQWAILPKHCLENVAPENFSADTFWQKPIGTGPFMVDTVKLGEYTILARNPEYFVEGTGNIEKMYLYPSTDAGDENLITNAMADKIDYAFCKDSNQVQQLMAMDGYNVETVNVTFPRYIFINMFEK